MMRQGMGETPDKKILICLLLIIFLKRHFYLNDHAMICCRFVWLDSS